MTGDVTRETAGEMARAMYSTGRSLNVTCFLVDATRAHNIERPLENVRLTRDDIPAARTDGRREVCIALLVQPGDRSHDFYAATARQQGIDTTIFWDRTEAVDHVTAAARRMSRHHRIQPE
jgi:hypothetical protein